MGARGEGGPGGRPEGGPKKGSQPNGQGPKGRGPGKDKAKKNFCRGKGMEQLARNKRLRMKVNRTCQGLKEYFEANGAPSERLRPIAMFDEEKEAAEGEDAQPSVARRRLESVGENGPGGASDNPPASATGRCELVVDIDVEESADAIQQEEARDMELVEEDDLALDVELTGRRRLGALVAGACGEDATNYFNGLDSSADAPAYSGVICGDAIDGLIDPDEAGPTIAAYSADEFSVEPEESPAKALSLALAVSVAVLAML